MKQKVLVSSIFFASALVISFAIPAHAGAGKSSSGSHQRSIKSHADISYSGPQHSSSHRGTYINGSGSSHKGGTYKNASTNDQYGSHKKK